VRDLTRAVADTDPGASVPVTVWRDGREQELSVEIAQMPSEQTVASVESGGELGQDGPRIGLALAALDDAIRAEMNLPDDLTGAVVTEVLPGSPAADKGLRQGDVIVEADHQAVTASKSVADAVKAAAGRGDKAVLLLVKRGDQDRFVAVRIDQA
jgi:serine protease Do